MNSRKLNDLNKKISRLNKKMERLKGGVTTSVENARINKINNKINQIDRKINKQNNRVNSQLNNGIKKNDVEKDLYQEIGILDPNAKNINPMTGEEYEHIDQYIELAQKWSELPVYEQRLDFIKAIYENQVILIAAGTGSGKTVLVPKYALHTFGYQGRIAVTNPKRIPSESAAEFAAKTLDVKLGEEVGYQHKFARMIDKGGKKTKLIFCTDGLINAKISGGDPLLKEYNMIIIDEAHERNVQIDFLLLSLRRAMLKRRDLKLIIMSATIDEQKFIDYFPTNLFKFKHLSAPGKPFKEIKEFYLSKPINKFDDTGNLINRAYVNAAVEQIIKIIGSGSDGNILVFLTSNADAEEACRLLQEEIRTRKINHRPFCIELHAKSKEEAKLYAVGELAFQNRNNGPWDRKVVMATDVAESAITFKDVIKHVIDSGLSNQDYYYTDKGMNALVKKYISKASHQQRRGRTGRQESGNCYNLFTKEEYQKQFPEYTLPPVQKTDLTDSIFRLFNSLYVSYGEYPFKYKEHYKEWKDFDKKDVERIINEEKEPLDVILYELIDPPFDKFIDNSLKNLLVIGALKGFDILNGRGKLELSKIGEQMNGFRSTPPEISRMILAGNDLYVRDDILVIAAMLENSEGQINTYFLEPNKNNYRNSSDYKKDMKRYEAILKKIGTSDGDHMSLYNLYHLFEKKKDSLFVKHSKNKGNNKVKNVFKELRQWCNENFINYKKLSGINQDYIKGYRLNLKQVTESSKKNTRSEKNTRSDNDTGNGTSNENKNTNTQSGGTNTNDNIIKAILAGFQHKFCRSVDGKIYICYPKIKTMTGIDKKSFLNLYKSGSKYYVYYDYINIFGQSNINIVSKVNANIVDKLPKNIFVDCFDTEQKIKERMLLKKKSNENKKKYGKRSDGKRSK